jgi:hypothetical protein
MVSQSLENGKPTCGIFVDLAKAFDTLKHDIIVGKLVFYGVRGVALDWIKSFLSCINQFVQISDENCVPHCSNKGIVTCGVPQGSILGPLLFILYINDIPRSSDKLEFTLFADDTTILYSGNSESELNNELGKVSNWFKANSLSLNVSKTKCILFGRSRHLITPKFNNHIITKVENCKFLGVIIDKNLSWSEHIKVLKQKLSRAAGVLNRVKNLLPLATLKLLYFSLVESHIIYCCEVWGSCAGGYLNQLHVIQKRAIRSICKQHYRAHTNILFKNLKILPVFDIVNLRLCILTHELLNEVGPKALVDKFNQTQFVNRYNTRLANSLYRIQVTTNYRKNCFLYQGPLRYNCLPDNIKQKPIRSFKFCSKQHFVYNL